ncbi:MAG: DUF790 family protein [Archaeoglobaceae archaeon]
MLPKEFLEVKKYKGKIFPKFAGESEGELAHEVINLFEENKGFKYSHLKNKLKEIENARNYKKVRAFARILERKCNFEVVSDLDPQEVRKYLFARGFVTTRSQRDEILEKAADQFSTSSKNIETAMFADRDEEQILRDVEQVDPQELVKEYNLSLLQTSVFDSLKLSFQTSSQHQEIFRKIKRLGLMYEIEDDEVHITGAASIIKMTKKYGTAMAKLIPAILKADEWKIRAEILDNYADKIFRMEMDHSQNDLFPEVDVPESYDSSLEKEFSRKIKSIKPELEVLREPGVFRSGKYAFIPDFVIRKGDKEVYIEIAGFWTSDYIKKKMQKVRETQLPLILVAREDYGIDKTVGDAILFRNNIPYNEVMKRINKEFSRDINDIELEGNIVNLKELSEEGVSMQDLSKLAESNGYIVTGSHAIKEELVDKVKQEVDKARPEHLSDVKNILDKHNVSPDVLEKIGYRIIWTGLFDDEAKLQKIDSIPENKK